MLVCIGLHWLNQVCELLTWTAGGESGLLSHGQQGRNDVVHELRGTMLQFQACVHRVFESMPGLASMVLEMVAVVATVMTMTRVSLQPPAPPMLSRLDGWAQLKRQPAAGARGATTTTTKKRTTTMARRRRRTRRGVAGSSSTTSRLQALTSRSSEFLFALAGLSVLSVGLWRRGCCVLSFCPNVVAGNCGPLFRLVWAPLAFGFFPRCCKGWCARTGWSPALGAHQLDSSRFAPLTGVFLGFLFFLCVSFA